MLSIAPILWVCLAVASGPASWQTPRATPSHTPPDVIVCPRWVSVSASGVSVCVCVYVRPQAIATWLWATYTFNQAPQGRRTLWANVDETAVCPFQGTGQGHVLSLKTDPAVQRVPIARRRTLCYFSFRAAMVLLRSMATTRIGTPPLFFTMKNKTKIQMESCSSSHCLLCSAMN